MWHYLYFLVLVKVKDPTEYTGPESYVAQMIAVSRPNARTVLAQETVIQETVPRYLLQCSLQLYAPIFFLSVFHRSIIKNTRAQVMVEFFSFVFARCAKGGNALLFKMTHQSHRDWVYHSRNM